MKKVIKEVYVTNDGIEFSTREDAIAYELRALRGIEEETALETLVGNPAEAIAILSQLLPEEEKKDETAEKIALLTEFFKHAQCYYGEEEEKQGVEEFARGFLLQQAYLKKGSMFLAV